MKKLYALSVIIFCSIHLYAQAPVAMPAQAMQPVVKGNYRLASRFSPTHVKKMVFSTAADPHWLKLSNRFWYMYETTAGRTWYIVDPVLHTKKPLFDKAKIAAEVSAIVKDPFDEQHLPIENIKFTSDEKNIQFDLLSTIEQVKKDRPNKRSPDSLEKKTFYFQYSLVTGKLQELKNYEKVISRPRWASVSPDSSVVVFSRKFNLYWMDKANYKKALKNEMDSSIVEHQLTKEGVDNYTFGGGIVSGGGSEYDITNAAQNARMRQPSQILWAPDSKHFALVRTDLRKVKDLWVINSLASPRPALLTYKYQMPGEKEIMQKDLVLFDFAEKTYKSLKVGVFKDQELNTWPAPIAQKSRDDEFRPQLWLGTNSKFYFFRTSRDLKRIDVCSVDINTGLVKPVVEERLNTFVEIVRPGIINGGKELVEWSERDGWAHFYLYDENGRLKNQITKGSFHCDEIVNIDEVNRVLYFTAQGVNPNQNPYYVHFYRINLDGTHMQELNPGNFTFTSSQSDDKKFVVSTYSRVNTAPKSALFDNLGHKVMDLETADLSNLMAAGYKFPEPLKVKADDGETDLYGVIYRPFDFDPNKKYPLIEYVYPGPQTESVNAAFTTSMDNVDRLAQLGFIVVTFGNRGGNPERSKWYHNFGYGNLRDYGLADKKAVAEELADKFPYIDIDRVGITGHSGGGFMSTAAILSYPDFFKAAVSESGNHDNSIYSRWWSEKHDGVKETITPKGDTTFFYDIDKNQDLGKNLKGHLMISTGDVDNNVSPSNTIRLANALIKANKRFDFVLLPGQQHGYGEMAEYFFWKKADYFVQWLMGDFSQPVDMLEMNRDLQMNNKSTAPPATGSAAGGRRGRAASGN